MGKNCYRLFKYIKKVRVLFADVHVLFFLEKNCTDLFLNSFGRHLKQFALTQCLINCSQLLDGRKDHMMLKTRNTILKSTDCDGTSRLAKLQKFRSHILFQKQYAF